MMTKDELKDDYLEEFASQRCKVGHKIYSTQLNAVRFRNLSRDERALLPLVEEELINNGVMILSNDGSMPGFALTQNGFNLIYTTTPEDAKQHIKDLVFDKFERERIKFRQGFPLTQLQLQTFANELDPKEEEYIFEALEELQKDKVILIEEKSVGTWITRT